MSRPDKVLTGLAASPGSYIGEAFLADSPVTVLEHPARVLVLKSAHMEWLEAILKSGAVVTEVGGRTSHAATICRELGKPCVTGVENVTRLLRSGMRVAVDGAAGTVTMLS